MRNFRRVLLVCLLCLMLLPVSALCEDGVAMGGSEVKEPEVRWTYGVSLTALQSPYLILVNEQTSQNEIVIVPGACATITPASPSSLY